MRHLRPVAGRRDSNRRGPARSLLLVAGLAAASAAVLEAAGPGPGAGAPPVSDASPLSR